MGHAWVTMDGPSGDECRVSIWITPVLPRMVPGVMKAEMQKDGMVHAWVAKDGDRADECSITEWVMPG